MVKNNALTFHKFLLNLFLYFTFVYIENSISETFKKEINAEFKLYPISQKRKHVKKQETKKLGRDTVNNPLPLYADFSDFLGSRVNNFL